MADSNITKRALADALKELMRERGFSKISVTDICEKCAMNRKSFYYHFKDKYDLVNWIFDTEFIAVVREEASPLTWDVLTALCHYFYQNRDFYRKALGIEGQNSFSEHFYELMCTLMQARVCELEGVGEVNDFQVRFFSDAAVMSIKRWILDKNCIPPDEFMEQLKLCIECAVAIRERDF